MKGFHQNISIEHDKGGQTINEAFDELSQEAFAFWIRMMTMEDEDFVGRRTIARKFKVSEGRSNVVLRELKNCGYLRFEPGPRRGTQTQIVLMKRVILVGRDRFIKLSTEVGRGQVPAVTGDQLEAAHRKKLDGDFKGKSGPGPGSDLEVPGPGIRRRTHLDDRNQPTSKTHPEKPDFKLSPGTISSLLGSLGSKVSSNQSNSDGGIRNFSFPADRDSGAPSNEETSQENKDQQSEKKSESEFSGFPEITSRCFESQENSSHSSDKPNSSNFRGSETTGSQVRKKNLSPEAGKQASGGQIVRRNMPQEIPEGLPKIKFRKEMTIREVAAPKRSARISLLDQKKQKIEEEKKGKKPGEDHDHVEVRCLTTCPTSKPNPNGGKTRKRGRELEAYLATIPDDLKFAPGSELMGIAQFLERDEGDEKRKRMVVRLGKSFRSVYGAYRRTFQPWYQAIGEKELRASEKAAVLCVAKGVRPSTLVAYWDGHVGEFTSQRFPALSFLSSPTIVDQASAVGVADPQKPEPRRRSAGRAERGAAPEVHAYNPDNLDPRLRPALVEAGFDLTEWSDRYLMTIQNAAKTVARGVPIFVSGRMKGMVDFAASHLFDGR